FAIELRVSSAIYLTHTAGAKRGDYLIWPEFVTSDKGHECGSVQFTRWWCAGVTNYERLSSGAGHQCFKNITAIPTPSSNAPNATITISSVLLEIFPPPCGTVICPEEGITGACTEGGW